MCIDIHSRDLHVAVKKSEQKLIDLAFPKLDTKILPKMSPTITPVKKI